MGSDAPDGTLLIQVGVTVNESADAPASIIYPPLPVTEVPTTPPLPPPGALPETVIIQKTRNAIIASNYATVNTYTVPAGKSFILNTIGMIEDTANKIQYQLTIGGVVQYTDQYTLSAYNPSPANCILVAGIVILIEAKSDGVTSYTVDTSIEGKEIG